MPKVSLPETDYDLFAVALLDPAGADVFRQDCNEADIRALFQAAPAEPFIHIWREFHHDTQPHAFRVWPRSRSKGWMPRIEQTIPHG